MTLDRANFRRACEPSRKLEFSNPDDQKLYIDFSSVRGVEIIEELKDTIIDFLDQPTCTLFTGHIGCGKSTELLRLKSILESNGFHVVYFESSDDLEMADVDICDVLLSIARRISESLEEVNLAPDAKGFRGLLEATKRVLLTEIDLQAKAEVLGQKISLDTSKKSVSLSAGIAELTVAAKNNQTLREKLNQYLGPQKNRLVDSINHDLIEPAIAKLKQAEKQGLVVIMDNLDRIDNRQKPFGRSQQEYLFIDQSECLTSLHCHVVYTMPLSLKFSPDYEMLKQRFGEEPKILPMIPVKYRDGSYRSDGVELLRQMILVRAFPTLSKQEQLNQISEVFEDTAGLDRLCQISGGHVRDVLLQLSEWIVKGKKLPLLNDVLEKLIRASRNDKTMLVMNEEWELLRQVHQTRKVYPDPAYQNLIRRRLIFEYRDDDGSWFDVNPILLGTDELQE